MSHQISLSKLEEIKGILKLPHDEALSEITANKEYSAFMLSVLNGYSHAAVRQLQTGEVKETKEGSADSVSVGTSFKSSEFESTEAGVYISCICCTMPFCDCC